MLKRYKGHEEKYEIKENLRGSRCPSWFEKISENQCNLWLKIIF